MLGNASRQDGGSRSGESGLAPGKAGVAEAAAAGRYGLRVWEARPRTPRQLPGLIRVLPCEGGW